MNLNLPELNTPDYPRRLRASLSDMTREIDRRLRMLEGGTWDGYHPVIGGYHIWIDETGVMRIKDSVPTYDGDGEEFSMGNMNRSAFGDLITATLTPVVQMDFVYGLNAQTSVTTTANGGTADTSDSLLRLQTGTNIAGSAIFRSKRPARYRAGQGMVARFAPYFSAGKASSTQIVGVGSTNDGYFIGYNGTAFGICHRVRTVNNWTAQTAWNLDPCDGTGPSGFNWDKTKGVPCQIVYPYLGFGDVKFFVQNPETGGWINFHIIKYANSATATQNSNPAMYFYAQAVNAGNNTNLAMYVGSVGIFISGDRSFVGNPSWGMDNNKSSITTETNILTLRNATTYNTVANTGLIRLLSMTYSSSANTGIAIIRLKLNPTLGGSPSYTTISGTTADGGVTITSGASITSYDVAGTTVTGGTLFASFVLDNPGSQKIDLMPYDLYVSPADILTISGYSSASAQIAVSVNWSEDL